MASCRFAVAVHALAVLACRSGGAVSSEYLARSINTNAVVVRRLLCALRQAGLVTSRKGSGGGTLLSRGPAEISLRQVYEAVECEPGLALHAQPPDPECAVGRHMQEVLPQLVAEAHEAVAGALARHTLAELVSEVKPATAR